MLNTSSQRDESVVMYVFAHTRKTILELCMCRYVHQLQDMAGGSSSPDGDADEDDESAAGQTQALLHTLLGPKVHLLHHIHKLLTLKEEVFNKQ